MGEMAASSSIAVICVVLKVAQISLSALCCTFSRLCLCFFFTFHHVWHAYVMIGCTHAVYSVRKCSCERPRTVLATMPSPFTACSARPAIFLTWLSKVS